MVLLVQEIILRKAIKFSKLLVARKHNKWLKMLLHYS